MAIVYGANYGAPTLDLNFSRNKSLIDTVTGRNLVTFTRSSTATYVGADGLIKTAAANEARFDHNPATGESLGLLVEESRTNQLSFSDFTSGNATTTNTLISGLPGLFSTGRLLTLTSNTIDSRIGIGFYPGSNVETTVSFYLRAGLSAVGQVAIRMGTNPTVNFNPRTGGFSSFGGPAFYNISMTNVGNGWWRCVATNLGNAQALFVVCTSDGGLNGNAGDSVIVTAFQMEYASFATSYIPTSGSAVTRAADVASMTGTNFSSWYRQDEGTFFVSARQNNNDSNRPVLGLGLSTGGIAQGFGGSGGGRYASWWNGSIDLITSNSTTWSTGARVGASYTSSSRHMCLNAGTVASSATTLPNGGLVRIGANYNNTLTNIGTISRLTYYPSRLEDFQLQQLTK